MLYILDLIYVFLSRRQGMNWWPSFKGIVLGISSAVVFGFVGAAVVDNVILANMDYHKILDQALGWKIGVVITGEVLAQLVMFWYYRKLLGWWRRDTPALTV